MWASDCGKWVKCRNNLFNTKHSWYQQIFSGMLGGELKYIINSTFLRGF